MKITAYTDGSYDREMNRCGYGAVLLTAGKEEIGTIYGSFTPAEDENGWNINGEIRAAMEAVTAALGLKAEAIEIFHDYEGVGKWAQLLWKRNKSYTKDYADWMQEKMREIDISFTHVKGHSGDRYNELADEAARRGVRCRDDEVHFESAEGTDMSNVNPGRSYLSGNAGSSDSIPDSIRDHAGAPDRFPEAVLLKNACLITEDGDVLTGKDVYICDGKIALIADHGQAAGDWRISDTIDCSRFFVSPGLVNLHAHTAMNIFKGIAEDVSSDVWFNEMIWPYESKMTGEDVFIGTKLGIAEMISHGVTAAADHYFQEEMVLAAARDCGIRMDIAPTIFGLSPDYKDRIAQVSEFIEKNDGISDRISFRFGPHSDYNCPYPVLGEIIDAAKSMCKPIHIHLSEEAVQVEESLAKLGKTPFEVLWDAGGFDLPVLVAHGLWIREEDLAFVNDKTWFALCPKTYMKLAMGRGGMFGLCDQVNCSFGTDGAASSNTLDPAEQARMFALLEKFQTGDAAARDARFLWKKLMAGHDAFTFGTGKMREGAPADLVIWDLWTPETAAFYDPLSAIIYSSSSGNVRYTMVGGEFLKYDGRLKMDTGELMEQTEMLQRSLLERGRGKAKLYHPG